MWRRANHRLVPVSPQVRRPTQLAAAGVLPFVVGRVAFAPPSAGDDDGLFTCPFRALTGLPCPLCGSTRGVVLASRGDGGFADFNAVTVLALAALAVYGLIALAVALRGGRLRPPHVSGRGVVALVAAFTAIAWAWTLTHRDTIVA